MHEAIVTKIRVQPHPDPEVHSLAVGYLFGETVIVSKETVDGQLGVYFPCELQLSEEFASANDLVRRKNPDGSNGGGMFDANRRVRIQTFKGIKSHGFWCPVSYFKNFGNTDLLVEGDKLTSFNGTLICQKYVTPKTSSLRNGSNPSKRGMDSVWFPKHKDTEQLKYSLNSIKPGDTLVVTLKVHGTSQRVAKTYDEKPEKWYDRVMKWFGFERNRLFLRYYNGTRNVTLKGDDTGFYSESFRNMVAAKLYPYLEDNMEIFFEVAGWETPNGTIMPSHNTNKSKDKDLKKHYGDIMTYSYGCTPGEWRIYVYRIAYVLSNGRVIDLTWDRVKEKCVSWGVNHVPELDKFVFDGNIDSMIEKIDAISDGPDPIDSRHIREGVCVRVDSSEWKCYKNKGFTFRVLEGLAKESDNYYDLEETS